MRPCVESNCEGVPWLCNLGNMQIDGEMGEGKKEQETERERKHGGV